MIKLFKIEEKFIKTRNKIVKQKRQKKYAERVSKRDKVSMPTAKRFDGAVASYAQTSYIHAPADELTYFMFTEIFLPIGSMKLSI